MNFSMVMALVLRLISTWQTQVITQVSAAYCWILSLTVLSTGRIFAHNSGSQATDEVSFIISRWSCCITFYMTFRKGLWEVQSKIDLAQIMGCGVLQPSHSVLLLRMNLSSAQFSRVMFAKVRRARRQRIQESFSRKNTLLGMIRHKWVK